ncbi:MAG: ABC transporter permease [Opitutales bacterium]|nr:ABC transporter permease [Opitutales bacterium]
MLSCLTQPFQLLWRDRHIALQFSERMVLQRTKGSLLGFFWQVLTPIAMMLLYTFIFGILLQGSFYPDRDESPMLYGLGIYLGLALLGIFTDMLNQSPTAIVSHTNLVKKVIFPLPLLPIAYLAASLIPAIISLVLAITAICLVTQSIPAGILWIPVIWLPLVFIAAGMGWLLSAATVYFRDINQITPIASQLAFWISGIFFPASDLYEFPLIWNLLKWNPILQGIDQMRNVMLWGTAVQIHWILYLYVLAAVCFYGGFYVFQGLRKGFADVM